MASNVSALSGIVANGHQAIHFVSSAPSKIPYGGFSPVRLQTRLTPRPPSRLHPHPLIGRHCRYLRPQRLSVMGLATNRHRGPLTTTASPVALGSPSGYIVRSAHRLLWPHLRLGRPPSGLCLIPPSCGSNPPTAEGPQFTPPVLSLHAVTRTPVVPATALDDVFIAGSVLRRISTGSTTTNPTAPDQVVSVTRLQRSLHATAWNDCLSCSGQDFYDRACLGRVAPCPKSVMTRWLHHLLPSPVFHRLDWQPYGLRANQR